MHHVSIVEEELRLTVKYWRYIIYRTMVVRKIQSKNSIIGWLFDPLLLIVSSLAITLVWNKLFGRGGEYFWEFFLYVFISFSVWNLFTEIINSSSNALKKNAMAATSSNEPISMYILLEVCCGYLNFLIRLPSMVILAYLLAETINVFGLFWFIYISSAVFLSGLGFGLCVGIYCLLYSDIKDAVGAVMRVAFLLTPIIWQVERLGEYQEWIYLNPFYSYLSVFRDVFLGNPIDTKSVIISCGLSVFMISIGLYVLAKNKIRVRERFFSV